MRLLFIFGSFILGALMNEVGDWLYWADWEPWVLSAPYWIMGTIFTQPPK